MRAWAGRCVILMIAVCVALPGASQDSAQDLAKKVDEHYANLGSMQAHFVEIYTAAGIRREESGTLYLKRPGLMRWEYEKPRDKVFLSDGKTAYFYVQGEASAHYAPVKKLYDLRSPLRYLTGRASLRKELEQLEIARDIEPLGTGNVVLRGVPRHFQEQVREIQIEITPAGKMVRLVAEETAGPTTEFRFSQVLENVWLADKLFRFSPPRGVQMVEMKPVE